MAQQKKDKTIPFNQTLAEIVAESQELMEEHNLTCWHRYVKVEDTDNVYVEIRVKYPLIDKK
ncbi:MAG: hypothetical protein ISN29_10765 [Gammaproteobacteria bacterium AqS3]|nr:hypothetical protein [Gammaproteobacteria bacterium AqS3]